MPMILLGLSVLFQNSSAVCIVTVSSARYTCSLEGEHLMAASVELLVHVSLVDE